MNDDMTTPSSPRPVPRHLPILTEVIGSQEAAAPSAATPSHPPPSAVSADVLGAQELLRQLGPDLDRRIAETIGRVLHEQLLGLNARVQKAVAEVVREAVASAAARSAHGSVESHASRPEENDS
ncbi:MAG: hypothetical protein Q4F13_14780 [Pseudomonadota bacterium]|nr:hypothetical protein [Pseudomonadota bacterium]